MDNWQDRILVYKKILDVIDIAARKIVRGSEATNTPLHLLQDELETTLIEQEDFSRKDIIKEAKNVFDRTLSEQSAVVLKGLIDGKTLEKISTELGVTASRCSQIFAKLKNNRKLIKALEEAGITPSDLSIAQSRQRFSPEVKPTRAVSTSEFAGVIHDFNNALEQIHTLRRELVLDLETDKANEQDRQAYHVLRKKIMMMRPRYAYNHLCKALHAPKTILT